MYNLKMKLTPQPQYKFDQPFALVNCSFVRARTPPIKSLYIKLKKRKNHNKYHII